MQLKVVAVTQPTIDKTPEEFIAYCARVSNPANQDKDGTGLVKYLIREKHWSPLEMVNVVCEVQTTRDISRQILRHRSFHFQEFSQRYAEQNDFETRDARLQDNSNRQNSFEFDDKDLHRWWEETQQEIIDVCGDAYKQALGLGIAKEQARALLPEGLTSTTLYMNGTLRDWYHYIALRQSNGTQKEHMQVAVAAKEALREYFPLVIGILDEA